MYLKQQAIELMNEWGRQNKPFLFIIDFGMKKILLFPLDAIPVNILFDIKGIAKPNYPSAEGSSFSFEPKPIPFEKYLHAFKIVQRELNYGNSYLLNLTFATELDTNLDLKTIFYRSHAPYKLLVEPDFVLFSPETFVRIERGVISSYPMKGTIDASIPNARAILLNDLKEKAEHATIVDLIRNDLNQIASDVRVAKYRYIEKVNTCKHTLLQVSSKIEGKLPFNYTEQLGDLFFSLLPAGSISGAPKKKTIEIIEETETEERGYYTGVFGVYDGINLDSSVMIRFIEQQNAKLVFKSGGGITSQSNARAEYQELIDKVYVPIV